MTFAEKYVVEEWTEYHHSNITSPRFMWKQKSITTEFFEKKLKFKGFDSQSVLILGGYNHAKMLDSSEVFFANDACHVPSLPNGENPGNSLLLTTGDHKVLTCGGRHNSDCTKICLVLDVQNGHWTNHSHLMYPRYYSIGISMPEGNYVFGGYGSPKTSDFLPKFSNTWKVGPSIPSKGIFEGCGLRISNHEIILIGGYSSVNVVIKYNTQTNGWTGMPNLIQGRYAHGCALINDKIIVSGGFNEKGFKLRSTEIIPLRGGGVPRFGGNLNIARSYLGLLAVVGGGTGRFPRILAFGGYNPSGPSAGYLNSIEIWNDETEEWKMAPFSMREARSGFGYLALPESTMCLINKN